MDFIKISLIMTGLGLVINLTEAKLESRYKDLWHNLTALASLLACVISALLVMHQEWWREVLVGCTSYGSGRIFFDYFYNWFEKKAITYLGSFKEWSAKSDTLVLRIRNLIGLDGEVILRSLIFYIFALGQMLLIQTGI